MRSLMLCLIVLSLSGVGRLGVRADADALTGNSAMTQVVDQDCHSPGAVGMHAMHKTCFTMACCAVTPPSTTWSLARQVLITLADYTRPPAPQQLQLLLPPPHEPPRLI